MKSGVVERLMTIFREKRKFFEVFLCQSLPQFKNEAILGPKLAKPFLLFGGVTSFLVETILKDCIFLLSCCVAFLMSQAKLLGMLNDVNKFWIFVTVI